MNNFNYKYLVLSDLDGTLLNSNGKIDQPIVDYVRVLNRREDILFCFSTGRSWDDAKEIYENLSLKGLVSCCNGGHIINPHKDFHCYAFINSQVWQKILSSEDFFSNVREMSLFTDQGTFAIKKFKEAADLLKTLNDKEANVFDIKTHFDLNINTDKVEIDKKLVLLKDFDSRPNIILYPYSKTEFVSIEVQASYASKEWAMKYIGNYYGVPPENILTFGDQINDLSVAQGFSKFTAVKNAIDVVKQYAYRVSLYSNDECSVVRELKIFLKSKDKGK